MSSIGQIFKIWGSTVCAATASAQASFVAFNAAAIAKVSVVFDSVAKLFPAAVAPYCGYAALGITALGSGVLAGFVLKGRVIDLNKGLKDEVAEAISEKKKTEAAKVATDGNGDVAPNAETAVYAALTGDANAQPSKAVKDAVESVRTQLGMAKKRVEDAKQAFANPKKEIESAKQTLAQYQERLARAEKVLARAKREHEELKTEHDRRESLIADAKEELKRFLEGYDAQLAPLEENVRLAKEALDPLRERDGGPLREAEKALKDAKEGDDRVALEKAVKEAKKALKKHPNHRLERERYKEAEEAEDDLKGKLQGLQNKVNVVESVEKPDLTPTQKVLDSAQEAVNEIIVLIQKQKATVDQAQARYDQKLDELKAELAQKVEDAEAAVNGFNAAEKVVNAVVQVVENQELEKIKKENAKVKGSWHNLKSAALKTAGVGLALFSTITTASTIGFVAGAAVPAVAAYGIGAAVPAATYFLVK